MDRRTQPESAQDRKRNMPEEQDSQAGGARRTEVRKLDNIQSPRTEERRTCRYRHRCLETTLGSKRRRTREHGQDRGRARQTSDDDREVQGDRRREPPEPLHLENDNPGPPDEHGEGDRSSQCCQYGPPERD